MQEKKRLEKEKGIFLATTLGDTHNSYYILSLVYSFPQIVKLQKEYGIVFSKNVVCTCIFKRKSLKIHFVPRVF